MALDEHLDLRSVRLGVDAPDWRAAVRQAGDALVEVGATTPAYGESMVDAVDRLGPYIVLAPGVALAHARPDESVLRTGLSLVVLAEPVEFGHTANDPVTVVVGLAALDHDAHLEALQQLAGAIGDRELVAALGHDTEPATARDRVLGRLPSTDSGARPTDDHEERTTS